MGYSAYTAQVSDAVIIPESRCAELLDYVIDLTKAEDHYPGQGRWSWTDQIDSYERSAHGVAKLFEDYGFVTDLDDNGDVRIECWGGDKLGSSYDEAWATLARFASNEKPVRWVFVGEDEDIWGACIENGQHFNRRVHMVVDDG